MDPIPIQEKKIIQNIMMRSLMENQKLLVNQEITILES